MGSRHGSMNERVEEKLYLELARHRERGVGGNSDAMMELNSHEGEVNHSRGIDESLWGPNTDKRTFSFVFPILLL